MRKLIFLPIVCMMLTFAAAQEGARQNETKRSQRQTPLGAYGVMLVPPTTELESLVLVQDLKASSMLALPVAEAVQKLSSGSRVVTIGELINEHLELQKRFSELNADYDRLAARYNRLAAISNQQPIQLQVPPTQDNSVLKYMLIQQMFSKPVPLRIDMRVRDCTKYPALCVGP